MRYQYYWNATLARSEIEGDAVRIAVVGSQRQKETSLTKKFEVSSIVTKQFKNAHCFERVIIPMQPTTDLIDLEDRS
jgi:hypothetical protein